MSNQTSSLKNEGEWARQRELQHAVLLYLTVHGPTNWDQLHLHLNKDATGEVGTALHHMDQFGPGRSPKLCPFRSSSFRSFARCHPPISFS